MKNILFYLSVIIFFSCDSAKIDENIIKEAIVHANDASILGILPGDDFSKIEDKLKTNYPNWKYRKDEDGAIQLRTEWAKKEYINVTYYTEDEKVYSISITVKGLNENAAQIRRLNNEIYDMLDKSNSFKKDVANTWNFEDLYTISFNSSNYKGDDIEESFTIRLNKKQ